MRRASRPQERGIDYALSVFSQRSGGAPAPAKQYDPMTAIFRDQKKRRKAEKKQLKKIQIDSAARASGKEISHIYAPKSRVLKPKVGKIAVKLKSGGKGYIDTATGKFTSNLSSVEDMLYSVDRSLYRTATPFSDRYARANDADKALIDARMQEIDWTEFWKATNKYDQKQGGLTDDGMAVMQNVFDGLDVTLPYENAEPSFISKILSRK